MAPAVTRFPQRFLADAPGVGVGAGLALPILRPGLRLACPRHALQVLGEATMLPGLAAGSVGRWRARRRFPVDPWYEPAFQRFGTIAARLSDQRDWVVLFDGTDTKRGGLAKSQNTRRHGKKAKQKKGGRPATQTPTFLVGLLVLPCGRRLPLPRKRCYTRASATSQPRTYPTPIPLAAALRTWLPPLVPTAISLVVLADSSFAGRALFTLGHDGDDTFIAKLKSNRTFADAPGQRLGA